MVRIYNDTDDSYLTVQEYIDAYDADDEDVYYVQFIYELTVLFAKAKRRTAFRGRYAKDEQGNSLLDRYAMTADEEDFFDEMLELGSGELFNKLLAWTKNVYKSYQYKATHDFGVGAASSVQFHITIPTAPYLDLFTTVEAKIDEALVLYTIKEWYLTNRLMDDYSIEQQRYDELAGEIKSKLMMKAEPTRRRLGFWKDY